MKHALSFKVGGIVSKILVEEGETVVKGQLLASLDLTEIDAQVSQSKNNLEKTKRDLERGKRLYADSAATLEQIQNLQTAFDVANEGFQIASFNRSYATIKATTSGKVIKKYSNEGEVVGPGSPVLLINGASQNEWIVKIGISDVDWIRIRKGDKALVTTDAYSNTSFDAEVISINEGAEAVSGLYQVEVKIKSNGKKLASGLVARVEIQTSQKQQLKSIRLKPSSKEMANVHLSSLHNRMARLEKFRLRWPLLKEMPLTSLMVSRE
jgi:RND family efflux transporter, MFP subunit